MKRETSESQDECEDWPRLGYLYRGDLSDGAAGYFLLLAPAQEQVTQLRGQLTTLQREVERNRAIVADLAKYRREVVELEARLNALKDRLPGEKEIPTLYRTLTDAAAA